MYSTKEILVSTTSNLEGWEIQQYLKPVSSHLVVGSNLFSDFFASFTDVFGGRSNTYQSKLSSLYFDAIEQLKYKAFELGANCIIGVSVDMDEISGKGKSMFMINAIGTAVVAKKITNTQNLTNHNNTLKNVSSESINNLRKRKELVNKANTNQLKLDDDTWNFIVENKVSEVYPFILNKWRETVNSVNLPETEVAKVRFKIGQYLNSLDEEKKYELVYDTLLNEKNEKIIAGLSYIIRDLQVLDLDRIKTQLSAGDFEKSKRILIALFYDKPYYSIEDLNKFKDLIELISISFQERGKRTMKKGVFSSKEKEVWTCECGKQNDLDSYCVGCDKDIYGFKRNEITPTMVIKDLKEKIELVSETLNETPKADVILEK